MVNPYLNVCLGMVNGWIRSSKTHNGDIESGRSVKIQRTLESGNNPLAWIPKRAASYRR